MKKLFFLGACLMTFASQPVRAQAGNPDIVVMQAYYDLTTLHIVTTHGPGKTESAVIKHHGTDQVEAVQNAIAALYQAGYSLKSTYGTGVQANFVFVKGQ